MIRKSRLKSAEREWGIEHPSDRVPCDEAQRIIWHANRVEGMSYVVIANTVGMTKRRIAKLATRQSKYTTRGTLEKLRKLETGYFDLLPTTLVDATPYVWIYRGLMAQGWSKPVLTKFLLANDRPAGWLTHSERVTQMTWRTAQTILWLRDQIADRRGPSKQTALRALRAGYFPLIHYNDEGQLLESSLTKEQQQWIQSSHG